MTAITCPECRTPSPTGVNRCPRCGYPLVLETRPPETSEVDRRLFVHPGQGEPPDTALRSTGVRPPTRPQQLPPGGRRAPLRPYQPTPQTAHGVGLVCPSCRRPNPLDRKRWCAWCGGELRPVRPTAPPPAWNEPMPRRAGLRWLVVACLVATLLVVLVWAFAAGRS